eukprot:Gb_38766 [translate_table: standard]
MEDKPITTTDQLHLSCPCKVKVSGLHSNSYRLCEGHIAEKAVRTALQEEAILQKVQLYRSDFWADFCCTEIEKIPGSLGRFLLHRNRGQQVVLLAEISVSQCPNKKKGKKKKEGQVAASAEANEFNEKFEREFSLVSIVSSSGSTECEDARTWIVDMHAVRGVGRVRFQLEFGNPLEMDEVLFVPGLKLNLLSVSALEDDGYAVLFEGGHVLIYPLRVEPIEAVLLGDRRDKMYIVRGQPMYGESGWLSDSKSEREAPEIEVVPSIQSSIQGSGRDAHSSTSRRITCRSAQCMSRPYSFRQIFEEQRLHRNL